MKKDAHELARYRHTILSVERGIPIKRNALLSVCLVFPNTYRVGMSNLATHTLYSILNSRHDCICERSFSEEPLTGYSLESGSRIDRFDIVAFSLSFELDYPNVLRTLRAGRVPPRSADRKQNDPLVIAGGPCVFSNPEPVADYVDLYAVGDGEEIVNEIMDCLHRAKTNGLERGETLRMLSEIRGVYVPALYTPSYSGDGALISIESRNGPSLPVKARIVPDLDDHPCCSVIMTPKTEFANMFLVELGRGCRRGCRFCSTCYTQLRRNRTLESLERQILGAREPVERVGLVTSDLADYPHREDLLHFLLDKNMGFSASSVRADAVTDDLLKGMKESRQRTLTLAPEVATEKLALLAGKRIKTEVLLGAVDNALKYDIINIRLYCMIGFPGEEDDDIHAMIELAARVQAVMKQAARASRKIGTLTMSVNPFVPKPFTPLESVPFANTAKLSRHLRILRQGLARIANTRLLAESPRMAKLQCIFSRGDRRVGRVAEMLAGGMTTSQAMSSMGDEIDRYLFPKPEDAGMSPWRIVRPPALHIEKTKGEQPR